MSTEDVTFRVRAVGSGESAYSDEATGTQLIPIANAVDYGDGGIIVGTTTAIPEPASLLVLAGGWAMLAQRRRWG